jgi:hypothetical protein
VSVQGTFADCLVHILGTLGADIVQGAFAASRRRLPQRPAHSGDVWCTFIGNGWCTFRERSLNLDDAYLYVELEQRHSPAWIRDQSRDLTRRHVGGGHVRMLDARSSPVIEALRGHHSEMRY